jgi:imidazolonepropionase-like amidohydrolase
MRTTSTGVLPALAAAAGVFGIACAGPEVPESIVASGATLAFENVFILDPENGPSGPSTVFLNGDSVLAVEEAGATIPEGARRVEASGLYMLPGLWNLHTHLAHVEDWVPTLMVTQGVTGARDLGGKLERVDAVRARIDRGELLGPRIVRTGPTLNGAQNAPFHRVIDSPESARLAVLDLQAAGVELLKTHNATEREPYFALLEAAREAELEVVGHVPTGLDPVEACEAGQSSIEHIATIFEGTYIARFSSELEAFQSMPTWLEEDAPPLVECFAEHQTLFVPTLRAYEIRATRAEEYDRPDPRRRYMSAEAWETWRENAVPDEVDRNPQVIELRQSLVDVGVDLVRMLHEAGAPIGAGTDLAPQGLLPGFDLHAEIQLLGQAGLTPREALQTSTRGPGAGAGGHPLQGQIVPGAPADLLLLEADAFEDLAALNAIAGVVRGGRYLDRVELDGILAGLERPASAE